MNASKLKVALTDYKKVPYDITLLTIYTKPSKKDVSERKKKLRCSLNSLYQRKTWKDNILGGWSLLDIERTKRKKLWEFHIQLYVLTIPKGIDIDFLIDLNDSWEKIEDEDNCNGLTGYGLTAYSVDDILENSIKEHEVSLFPFGIARSYTTNIKKIP